MISKAAGPLLIAAVGGAGLGPTYGMLLSEGHKRKGGNHIYHYGDYGYVGDDILQIINLGPHNGKGTYQDLTHDTHRDRKKQYRYDDNNQKKDHGNYDGAHHYWR